MLLLWHSRVHRNAQRHGITSQNPKKRIRNLLYKKFRFLCLKWGLKRAARKLKSASNPTPTKQNEKKRHFSSLNSPPSSLSVWNDDLKMCGCFINHVSSINSYFLIIQCLERIAGTWKIRPCREQFGAFGRRCAGGLHGD